MFSAIGAWFTASWGAIVPWLLGGLALVVTGFGLRQSGKSAAYADIAQKQLVQTQGALNVQTSVANLSDDAVTNKLREFYRN